MTIEQTKHFRETVDHLKAMADYYRYQAGRDAELLDYLQRLVHMRGRDYVVKAAKKANQRAKYKAFQWEAI